MARPQEHKPEAILAAATRLFSEEGVGVSTARIARAAGVSNGTLFNYFPTKQSLIDALYVSIKDDFAAAIGDLDESEPIERQLRQMWESWLGWARRNRAAHAVKNLLHQSGLASADAVAAGEQALLGPQNALVEAIRSGLIADLPLDYLGALMQHQLDLAVTSELDDEQTETAFNVMLQGITATTRQRTRKTGP